MQSVFWSLVCVQSLRTVGYLFRCSNRVAFERIDEANAPTREILVFIVRAEDAKHCSWDPQRPEPCIFLAGQA